MSSRMEAFLKEDRKKGFDFALKSPLMRFYLIKESKYSFFFFFMGSRAHQTKLGL